MEERLIVKSAWSKAKRYLEGIGVPTAELGVYFDYLSEGLFKGFTDELKKRYSAKGCSPEILEAVERLVKHDTDIVIRSRLYKIKSKIKRGGGEKR